MASDIDEQLRVVSNFKKVIVGWPKNLLTILIYQRGTAGEIELFDYLFEIGQIRRILERGCGAGIIYATLPLNLFHKKHAEAKLLKSEQPIKASPPPASLE